MSNGNFFSIDVDAHLKKAAAYTFGSSSHFPVELVRAALRRGAGQVDVESSARRVTIKDDGGGLDKEWLDTLLRLLEKSIGVEEKETAVERVQETEGYGLLALFAPSPERIILENVSPMGKCKITYERGQARKSNECGIARGTSITLYTATHRDLAREKQILEVYCQGVSCTIRLNGNVISGGSLLSNQLGTMEITSSKFLSSGVIGVPAEGDLCRVRLLDQGIPYRYVTLPPYKGFIFDAAVEISGELTRGVMNHLSVYSQRLYKWLCGKYASATPAWRVRIEELMFTHFRLTGDVSLYGEFAPFKVYGETAYLNLDEVMGEAENGSIYAVPRNKEKMRYHTGGRRVLSLTREQADFLINRQNLPVTFLSPQFQKEKKWSARFYRFKKMLKRLIMALLPKPSGKKILQRHQLTEPEITFLEVLSNRIKKEIVMVSSSGPFPAVRSRQNNGLLVRRNHRLVKKAVKVVAKDVCNIDLFIGLII